MIIDDKELRKIELEVKNLTALRSNYFTLFIVLSGGIAGIFLTELNSIKLWVLLFIGFVLDYCFLLKIQNITYKIDEDIKRV